MNALVIAAVLASLSTVDASHGVETRLHVGIPSVCVSPRTGRLWATWYAGPSKGEDLNNYLLIKHGKIGETTRKRSHLRAFVSRNDGKTWEGGLLLDEREGVSYPDACQLADGTIAVVYDYNRVSDRQIQLVLFSERDVLAEAVGKKGVGERHVVSSPTMTLAEGKVSFLSCQPLQYRDMVGKIGF